MIWVVAFAAVVGAGLALIWAAHKIRQGEK